MLGPRLFHGLVPTTSTARSGFDNTCSSSGVSVVSDYPDSVEKPAKRQQLIPSQLLGTRDGEKAKNISTTMMKTGTRRRIGGGGGSGGRTSGNTKSDKRTISSNNVHTTGAFTEKSGHIEEVLKYEAALVEAKLSASTSSAEMLWPPFLFIYAIPLSPSLTKFVLTYNLHFRVFLSHKIHV
ncbi:Uncharacterized protein Fot_52556 [Forsythia ovata]|uniref:Uncharacterized protein n=1 Tax=Forsythia ovata TaxID=205694 RepID=A0ABD1PL21_9LAMI